MEYNCSEISNKFLNIMSIYIKIIDFYLLEIASLV